VVNEKGVLLKETFGTTASGNPSVASYTGYSKTGLGAANVDYKAAGGAVSVRTTSPSSSYEGASGSCNAMMGTAGATLEVKNIASCGAQNLKLSFGTSQMSDTVSVAYSADNGTTWTDLTYSKTDTYWGLVSDIAITLPANTTCFALKFTAGKTQFGSRVDDIVVKTDDATGEASNCSNGGNVDVGTGTFSDPYNIAAVQGNQGATGKWVMGYVVGVVNGTSYGTGNANVRFSNYATANTNSNLLIADSPDEVDAAKCVPIQLTGSPYRDILTLVGNDSLYKKQVKLRGTFASYLGHEGVKTIDGYWMVADNIGADPDNTTLPEGTIFSATLLTQASYDEFSATNVLGDQVWSFSTSSYGAVMSGYVVADEASYANEDWFISPAIDLTEKSNVALTFDHARGPVGSMAVSTDNYTLWVSTDYTTGLPATANWTQLTIPTHGTTQWSYVSSGSITLPIGNANTRFAFKYVCNGSESATWEVKNILVKEVQQ
jgi:hypothetical protein